MNKNATKENLNQLWKKTKFYTDERLIAIPDRIGYWNGNRLVLDNLDPGIYTVKYISDTHIVCGECKISVGATVGFNITLPENTIYLEVYNSQNEKVGRIRTDIPVRGGENTGTAGADGKSAYDIWLELGNTGTEQNFIDSLKGVPGKDGYTPVKGKDYYTSEDMQQIVNEVIAALPSAEGVSF